MADKYEVSEKDIATMLRYLKIFEPENATREEAITRLHNYNAGSHIMAHNNPDLLERLDQELKENKHHSEDKED